MQRFFFLFLILPCCFLHSYLELPSIEFKDQEKRALESYLQKIEGPIETQQKQIAADAARGDEVALYLAGLEYLTLFTKGQDFVFINKACRCFEASGRLGFAPALRRMLQLHLSIQNKQSTLFAHLYVHLLLSFRHQEYLPLHLELSQFFKEIGGEWLNERIKQIAQERHQEALALKKRLRHASQKEIFEILFAQSPDEELFEELKEYAEQLDMYGGLPSFSISERVEHPPRLRFR